MLGINTASLLFSYTDYPEVTFLFEIELEVLCPDQHTEIVKKFKTTLAENPIMYYDMLAPMTFPMNYWGFYPESVLDQVSCFHMTSNSIIDTDTGLAVDYITVTDFSQGIFTIDQRDASFLDKTIVFIWELLLNDGTYNSVQTFTIIFQNLVDCSQTQLEHGWPQVEITQKFFEANPTKLPLPQPTDSLANEMGQPDLCGERGY